MATNKEILAENFAISRTNYSEYHNAMVERLGVQHI